MEIKKTKEKIRRIIGRLYWLYKNRGLLSCLSYISGKIIHTYRYQQYCSSVDLRNSHVKLAKSAQEFMMLLLPDLDEKYANAILEEAMVKLKDNRDIQSPNFPSKWNSGRNLQLIIYSLTRILTPMLIVETGTANGTSANSWASGLKANNKGKIFTIDIKKTALPAVDAENMGFLECVVYDGSVKNLSQIIKSIKNDNSGFSIFLHDSDHSYFGQFTDYDMAKHYKFNLLISDDIDSSMAFIDFTLDFNAIVMYDERKFIGAVVLSNDNV